MNAAKRPATTSAKPEQPRSSNGSSHSRVAITSGPSRHHHQPKRTPYAGARQAIVLESSVKLTVNLLLAIVATTTIAKLVPYYQSQQQRLNTLQASVQVAERKHAKLKAQFDRNFDPTQASQIMQEQSGMASPNQKKIVWQSQPDLN
ncbi:MAG: hypothetical protein WA885_16445 [Phormidesmis sp.]